MSVRSVVRSTVAPYLTPSGRQAAWNLGWMMAGTVVGQACGMIATLVFANSLGRERWGVVATGLSVQGYMLIVSGVGARPVLVREIALRPDHCAEAATAYLVTTAAASLSVSILAALGVLLIPMGSGERSLLLILAIGNVLASLTFTPLFDAFHRQARVGVITAGVEISFLAMLSWLVRSGDMTVQAAGIYFACKWGVQSVLLAIDFCRSVQSFSPALDSDLLSRFWRAVVPVTVSSLAGTVPITGGVLLVRAMLGAESAGVMGLATLVLQAFLMFGAVANRIMQPHINGRFGLSRSFIRKLSMFYCGYFLMLLVLALVGTAIVVHWLLSEDYSGVGLLVALLMPGALALSASRIVAMYLLALHREVETQTVFVSVAVIHVVVAAGLIRVASVQGAAWAFVLSSVLGLVWLGRSLQRSIRLDVANTLRD
ncbi:MAG: oligosaccharide flippase family protein [Maioricimonas sp. JB045]